MAMDDINLLYKEFDTTGLARIQMIYIAEAHALDEWPMGDGFGVSKYKAFNQPKSVQERINIAKVFKEELKCLLPILVDGPDDHFERAFASWPLRFYVIKDGKIIYKAQPKSNYRYSVSELREFLFENTKASAQLSLCHFTYLTPEERQEFLSGADSRALEPKHKKARSSWWQLFSWS